MVAQPYRTFMSVEDYLALDRDSLNARYEYIDGYAYMMAGGTLDHSSICINVTSLLRRLLHGGPCRVYNSDARVRLSEERYVYPDATVSCDERDRGTRDIILFPRVVVEVLSPGTASYDRGDKFVYYRSCPTIEEYVLVDTQRQSVDVYRRASNTLWTLHLFGPGDRVELARLNISFPIVALYVDVDFPGEPDAPDGGFSA
ncbi:MAG TPA: Uma2 family endonuclease [Ktedonobacteraceae bacterium]|nr:Uma2 family endonuclease [Ktedonobacteraceae bacterium]